MLHVILFSHDVYSYVLFVHNVTFADLQTHEHDLTR